MSGSLGALAYRIEPSFGLNDKAFLTKVTLTNTGAEDLHSVRYMRDVDPDNTVDFGGDFVTINSIDATIAAGDAYAAVSAKSLLGDPYYALYSKQAIIVYFSSDSRCRVAYGVWSQSIYGTFTYDLPMAKGTNDEGDEEVRRRRGRAHERSVICRKPEPTADSHPSGCRGIRITGPVAHPSRPGIRRARVRAPVPILSPPGAGGRHAREQGPLKNKCEKTH